MMSGDPLKNTGKRSGLDRMVAGNNLMVFAVSLRSDSDVRAGLTGFHVT
jgi:hypothetical protein